EVNLAIINGLKAKGINILEIKGDHLEAIADIMHKAITVTRCCESDSELLPSFLYKSDGGLYFKHRENTDVTQQWNEYLKTR
ncbi:MAG: hypothetical protein GY739_09925, partial [Mesoflavibacter sp.]|nr:hypothetical protein [Mesoflavibacter sp.]